MKDQRLFDGPETHIVQVVGVRYHDSESMFTVMEVEDEDGARFVAVGEIPDPSEGSWYRLVGAWKDHPRFGRQFRIREASPAEPNTKKGLVSFLAGAKIKGVGEATAKRIVEHFGERTIEILDSSPDRLMEVPGIGRATALKIRKSWEEFREEREGEWRSIMELMRFEIPYSLASAIVKTYRDEALDVVKKNPYRLVEDVSGIGFVRADAIARKMGIPADSDARMAAALLHVLKAASEEEGHVYLPESVLYERVSQLVLKGNEDVHLDDGRLSSLVESLEERRRIVVEDGESGRRIYLRRLHRAERVVASRLAVLMAYPSEEEPPTTEEVERIIVRDLGLTRDEKQVEAIVEALSHNVSIITGGPGTGKTTIVRAIVEFAHQRGLEVCLAAPTGRAAKRLSESTGHEAKTIHRLLQYHPQVGFQKNAENPLYCDLVVIDETSMVDIHLMYRVVDALEAGTKLILVGDHNQLPSVGPGAVLRDLIASGVIPTVTLRTVFRQAHDSLIVQTAMAILSGAGIRTGRGSLGDVAWEGFRERDPVKLRDRIVRLVTEVIPERYGIDPLDIQVLSPMNKGTLGTGELNYALQNRLNPDGKLVLSKDSGTQPLDFGDGALSRVWRVGDKVIQLVNNYELDIYNGDMGIISGVDGDTVYVDFYGRTVKRSRSELATEMSLAYAISIHKSQGSEFPAVVIPIHTQHWIMLRRPLLYTAVTRAKRLVVIVGPHQAVLKAVRTDDTEKRYTTLAQRLREEASQFVP